MPTSETGDATSYPIGITIPSDGDGPIKAADVNAGFEGLADRTANLHARLSAQSGVAAVAFTTTAAATWTAGTHDRRVELVGWGGGGGGGGGGVGGGLVSAADVSYGGGGGGAPLARRLFIEVTSGTTYEALCGDGGAGGAGGAIGVTNFNNGVDGVAGGDTIFRIQGGAELARFKGAQGGRGATTGGAGGFLLVSGGGPVLAHRPAQPLFPSFLNTSLHLSSNTGAPGFGGDGVAANASQVTRKGASSLEGFTGGNGGAFGAATASTPGGGSGGGGAAGPGGNGLSGLAGGAGVDGGTGGAAPLGAGGAADNTGAGGGGGGGGGSGTGAGGSGSPGRAGSSGSLTLRVIG